MARPKSDRPAYCRHKQSGRGIVTIDGKQHLLPGPHNSEESRVAYDRLVGRWLAAGRRMPAEAEADGPTISTVLAAFWRHAQAHYVKPDGTPTGEAENYRFAIRPLRRLYGNTPAAKFGPKMLRTLRDAMLLPTKEKDPKNGKEIERRGWSRKYANRMTNRVKLMFKWAAAEELVPASTHAALCTVEALRKGRGPARETASVEAVPEDLVIATLPHLAPPVAAIVKLQLYTGARGGELFRLRPCDIDTSGIVWKAHPADHKTAHHEHERTLMFGPRSREVLSAFLTPDRPTTAYLFSPAEAHAWMKEEKRKARKTKVQPSQRLRAEQDAKRKPKPRPHFTRNAYSQAIAQACQRAKLPHWHPHQLRHTAGTAYRREGDFEAAKIVLGHESDSMTQNYAERDGRKAEEIVSRIG